MFYLWVFACIHGKNKLLFTCVFVWCMHVCVCLHVCGFTCMWVHVHIDSGGCYQIWSSIILHFISWGRGYLWICCSPVCPIVLAIWFWRSVSQSPSTGITGDVPHSPNFYVDSGDLNLGYHIYILLASFVFLWHKLESCERREKQLQNASINWLDFFLINDLCGQTIVDGDTPESWGV